MFALIGSELKEHAPFTAVGALTGIVLMFIFRHAPEHVSHELFYVFHPLHVLLSALVTAAMYRRHSAPTEKRRCNVLALLAIGYFGSIGIATLSDSLMPYIGEVILEMPYRHLHVGFIEKRWLISTMAVVGIIIAYFNPTTKFPHSAHVLISTWASLFHILMALGKGAGWIVYGAVFIFLFLAVWLPCCISDIVFPLLFVRQRSGGDE